LLPAEGNLYFDAISVDSERGVDDTLGCRVAVIAPGYCSDVRGDTRVTLAAAGFKTVTVRCCKGGGRFGSDSTVATVALDGRGNGSFVLPADGYPHGPITVRICGDTGFITDNCYLQLYNNGGRRGNSACNHDTSVQHRILKDQRRRMSFRVGVEAELLPYTDRSNRFPG
jgi:hypothetical protein